MTAGPPRPGDGPGAAIGIALASRVALLGMPAAPVVPGTGVWPMGKAEPMLTGSSMGLNGILVILFFSSTPGPSPVVSLGSTLLELIVTSGECATNRPPAANGRWGVRIGYAGPGGPTFKMRRGRYAVNCFSAEKCVGSETGGRAIEPRAGWNAIQRSWIRGVHLRDSIRVQLRQDLARSKMPVPIGMLGAAMSQGEEARPRTPWHREALAAGCLLGRSARTGGA